MQPFDPDRSDYNNISIVIICEIVPNESETSNIPYQCGGDTMGAITFKQLSPSSRKDSFCYFSNLNLPKTCNPNTCLLRNKYVLQK